MAVTNKLYSNFPLKALRALISDMAAASKIKCMLVTSGYAFDQENHTVKTDITNEVSGTGYTAGGAYLTSPTVAEAARVTTFDAADTPWTSSTITARGAVLYGAVAANNPLVAFIDFGENKSSDNGTFTIQWSASGIFTITVAA